jgi:hypothetical protein
MIDAIEPGNRRPDIAPSRWTLAKPCNIGDDRPARRLRFGHRDRLRMIFFSVGLPGHFSEMCDQLVLGLTELALGSVALIPIASLDDVAFAVLGSEEAHLVAASRQPVVRLQSAIVQSGRPFVIAAGELYAALYDIVQRPGYDVINATRELASSCAALLDLTKAPQALVLADGGDAVALAAAINRHFGFGLSDAEVAQVAHAAAGAATEQRQQVALWREETSEHEQAIIAGALAPYERLLASGGALEPLVWERDLFYVTADDSSGTIVPATEPIDVTGRARFLVFGPYINLAPGSWSATVVAGFSAETAGSSFIIEIAAGIQLAYTRVQPTGEQVIETDLQFAITDAASQPVEVRIVSERAAFEGRIALGHVHLAPRVRMPSETEQGLIEALHR